MPDATELRNRGLKATLPRLQILEIFQKADARHLTAEEGYRLLFKQGHEVGLATVYRVQEFHDEAVEQRQRLIALELGFEVVEHSHILYGGCTQPQCERRRRTASVITRKTHELQYGYIPLHQGFCAGGVARQNVR